MNMHIISGLIFILMALNIAGCGFGGFSESDNNEPGSGSAGSSDTRTKINGVASKGVFTSGTVRVYAVNSDGETKLSEASIIPLIKPLTSSETFKNYSSSISSQKTSTNGSYTGVHKITASGSYLDEATGTVATIDDAHPLRAYIANPSGDVHVAVTPLTELAARKALFGKEQRQLTATDIQEANALVSKIFKVDIIGTQPVMADKNDSNGFGNGNVTQEQRDYTLALAAISQMAKETGGVNNLLEHLSRDINADGTLSQESADAFQSALAAFFTSQLNQTGVTSVNDTNLAYVGGMTKKVRLVTAMPSGLNIQTTGIIVTVLLPQGVTLKADYRNNNTVQVKPLLSGVVTKGIFMPEVFYTVYIPTQGSLMVGLIKSSGFSVGEFCTIQYEVKPGVSVTASDFEIYKHITGPDDIDPNNLNATDLNGDKILDTDISVSVEELLPE